MTAIITWWNHGKTKHKTQSLKCFSYCIWLLFIVLSLSGHFLILRLLIQALWNIPSSSVDVGDQFIFSARDFHQESMNESLVYYLILSEAKKENIIDLVFLNIYSSFIIRIVSYLKDVYSWILLSYYQALIDWYSLAVFLLMILNVS